MLVPNVASDEEAEDAGRVNGGTGSLPLVEATDLASSWSATDTAEGDLMAVFLEDMESLRDGVPSSFFIISTLRLPINPATSLSNCHWASWDSGPG